MPNRSHMPDPAPVARAFQMALQLPTSERERLRVVVLSADGGVLGAATLQGREQAELLRDQLRIVGSFDFGPGEMAGRFGCDLVLHEVPGEDEGPTTIRRGEGRPVKVPRRPRGAAGRGLRTAAERRAAGAPRPASPS